MVNPYHFLAFRVLTFFICPTLDKDNLNRFFIRLIHCKCNTSWCWWCLAWTWSNDTINILDAVVSVSAKIGGSSYGRVEHYFYRVDGCYTWILTCYKISSCLSKSKARCGVDWPASTWPTVCAGGCCTWAVWCCVGCCCNLDQTRCPSPCLSKCCNGVCSRSKRLKTIVWCKSTCLCH